MGRLEDRLLNHAAHQQLREARAALNSLSEDTRAQADTVQPEGSISRAHDALDHVDGLLAASDPTLLWQGLLDSVLSQLGQVQSYAAQVASQPQMVGALDQAIDGLMSLAAQLAASQRISPKTTKRINASLGRALTTTVRELEGEVQRLKLEATQLDHRQREAAAKAMAGEEQRRAEIAARLDELRTAVSSEKQRLDALVPNFEQQFVAAQAQREKAAKSAVDAFDVESNELFEGLKADADKAVKDASRRVQALVADSRKKVDAALEHVETKRDEVDRLVGVISATGTASVFRDQAKEQKQQANLWRWIAIAFAVAAAAAALWAGAHSDQSTRGLVARLALTAAAGAIAGYAAKQSSRHRHREEEARQLELDLTAFGPFIDSLPEEKQQLAREELIKRIFIGRAAPLDGKVLTEDSFGVLEDVVNLVLKASRAKAPS